MDEPTAENAIAVAVQMELTGKWEQVMKGCPWRIPNMTVPRCAAQSSPNHLVDCTLSKCAVIYFMRGL